LNNDCVRSDVKTNFIDSCYSQKNIETMGLFKTALIGAAVYGAVKYLTKKDVTGRSKFDDIKAQAPEWIEKAKAAATDLRTKLPESY